MTATVTNTVTAVRITPYGEVADITLTLSDGLGLQSLYEHINCRMVECFAVRASGVRETHVDAWMDEEGRINGSGPNFAASAVIAHLAGQLESVSAATVAEMAYRNPGLIHYGVVVMVGFEPEESGIADVPADVLTVSREVVARLS